MGAYEEYYGGGFVGMPVTPQGMGPTREQALTYDLGKQIQQKGTVNQDYVGTLMGLQEGVMAQKAAKAVPAEQLRGMNFASMLGPKGLEKARGMEDVELSSLKRSLLEKKNRLAFSKLRTFGLLKEQFPESPEGGGTEWPSSRGFSKIKDWIQRREAQLTATGYSLQTAFARAMAEARANPEFAGVHPDAFNAAVPAKWHEDTKGLPWYGVEIGPQRAARLDRKQALSMMDDSYYFLEGKADEYIQSQGEAGQPTLQGFLLYLQDKVATQRSQETDPEQVKKFGKDYPVAERRADLMDDADRLSLLSWNKGLF